MRSRENELLISMVFLRFRHDLPYIMAKLLTVRDCKLGYKCFPLLFPCPSAMWLCISSHQNVESISLPLESWLGHVTWLDQWTSVHLMQWRLERCLITESCPLPDFRTEPSCEEVWDRRDMCPIWVALKSTSLLISRHISVIVLDHSAPSWP